MMQRRITARFTEAEHEHVVAQARAAGIPTARYLREAVTGITIRPQCDVEILRELRRLGGLAKYAITQCARSQEADAAFRALSDYAASLVREVHVLEKAT